MVGGVDKGRRDASKESQKGREEHFST